MEKNIRFEDAQEMRRRHPDTFYAPEKEELQKLRPGDTVKVCAFSERFWAEIVSVDDGRITARVDNNLLTSRLRYNDLIEFHQDNVYDIFPGQGQPQGKSPAEKKKNNRQRGRRL